MIPTEGDDPAAKTPYMVSGDKNLYISDDDGMIADEPPVTGIQVNAGVILILGLNMNTGQDMAQINLANDSHMLGTIKTKDLTTGTVGGGVVDTMCLVATELTMVVEAVLVPQLQRMDISTLLIG